MFEALIQDSILSLDKKNGHYLHNGNAVDPDIKKIGPNEWHILYNQKSYNVFLLKVDKSARTVTLSINEKKTVVKIKTQLDKLLQEMGLEGALEQKVDSINAPMPGLIKEINVKSGDEVKKGDPVLILEAMKMENVIKAPGDGVIADVHVKIQDSVEKNELMISLE
ncbi:acetyl-CoA carboxylase biotin carboxyl carrier protein subunit [bacterium]|nr:acetyl-CoA carboxylase biotin carboxyl carrier protein subunit [bacterium]